VIAERAIGLFAPKALLFVGVAGALTDDLRLGDVVVATRIYEYHSGKEEREEFVPRPRSWEASHQLEQLARHVDRAGGWIGLSPDHKRTQRQPAVHFKPIAAGEVVSVAMEKSPAVASESPHLAGGVLIGR